MLSTELYSLQGLLCLLHHGHRCLENRHYLSTCAEYKIFAAALQLLQQRSRTTCGTETGRQKNQVLRCLTLGTRPTLHQRLRYISDHGDHGRWFLVVRTRLLSSTVKAVRWRPGSHVLEYVPGNVLKCLLPAPARAMISYHPSFFATCL